MRFALCLGAAGLLAACGGGGDAADPVVVAPVVPVTATLSGTAATGAPAANAAITVVCAGGAAAFTTTADAAGRFTVVVNQAPCLVKATFGTPAQTLYSMTTAAGTVDISPFTDLVVAAWGHALPDAVFAAYDPAHPTAIDATALADAIALVKRRIANAGVTIDALDLLHQGFAAQAGDVYDNAIEALLAAAVPQLDLRTDVAAGRDRPLPPTLPPLPTVAEVTLIEPGDGVARVTWSPVQEGVSYTVFYDPTNTGPNGPALTQMAAGASPLIVGGLVNGTDYLFQVQASNARGTVTGAFVHVTPKATGLTFQSCPAGNFGCFDPHRGEGGVYGAFYTGMAYTRTGGADHYIAVKSNRQIMHMADDEAPEHLLDPAGGANYTALNAVAASEDGIVLAVGDSGLIMKSDDGGKRWSTTNLGFAPGIAATTTWLSVTYGAGKFVAVGKAMDEFGKPHDVILTHVARYACPAGATCTSFSGTTAYAPTNFSGLNQVAFGDGLFVALGNGNYYRDGAGVETFGSNASYTSADGVTFAFKTPAPVQSFNTGADKLFFYKGLFWGLIGGGSDTGGYRSADGATWGNAWQVTNPGSPINDVAIGVGQIVAIDAGGYAYVNKSGAAPKSAWVGSSPQAPLQRASFQNEKNLLVYGHGRYVAISNGTVYVSK